MWNPKRSSNLGETKIFPVRWKLDGKAVNNYGIGYTKNHEVIQFKLSDMLNSTRRVTWQIKFTHAPAIEDSTLHCEALYTYITGTRSLALRNFNLFDTVQFMILKFHFLPQYSCVKPSTTRTVRLKNTTFPSI